MISRCSYGRPAAIELSIRALRVENSDYAGGNAGPPSISVATRLLVIFNSLSASVKYGTTSQRRLSSRPPVNQMPRPSIICLLFVLTGCASIPQERDRYRAASPPRAPISAVVFVANGAGDSRATSRNLAAVVAETGTPLQVETVVWSRGSQRIFADQMDRDNQLTHGRKLASDVSAYRCAHPGRKIHLLGHSAGCAVVLSAAELLPPGSIDRMVLLSPSVCTSYDLRPALAVCREGIESYYSSEDRWVLGLGMRVIGTAEGDCGVAAGRVGFETPIGNATDVALYNKLQQHPWDLSVTWAGHYGGHFGNTEPKFLRWYVLPLFFFRQ